MPSALRGSAPMSPRWSNTAKVSPCLRVCACRSCSDTVVEMWKSGDGRSSGAACAGVSACAAEGISVSWGTLDRNIESVLDDPFHPGLGASTESARNCNPAARSSRGRQRWNASLDVSAGALLWRRRRADGDITHRDPACRVAPFKPRASKVMRIAQVAPLTEAVPPKLYGGTERVVAYLSDALVELGHEVTLFASGDSLTKAQLAAVWPHALRLDPEIRDFIAPIFMMLEQVARRAHEFDVVHSHLDYFGYPLMQRLGVASITTLHGRLDLPELKPLYQMYDKIPVVSISDSQREPL